MLLLMPVKRSSRISSLLAVGLGLAVAAVSSSCVQIADPAGDNIVTYHQPNETIEQMIAGAEIHCQDTSSQACSPSVAMLISKNQSSTPGMTDVHLCTSFLIAPDTMMTNSHCIPTELRTAGASCAGKIRFLFADAGGVAKETAGCDQIISASPISNEESETISDLSLQPDYAVVHLDRVMGRPSFPLSRGGVADLMQLQVDSMEPTSKTEAKAVLISRTCTAHQGTDDVPQFKQNFSSTIATKECTVHLGNSGSPMRDSDGAVRGILFAIAVPNSKAKGISLGVNLACMVLPQSILASNPPAACQQ